MGSDTMSAERRKSSRRKVAHPVRLRPADAQDAPFEEVQESRDVSKEGLSFITQERRYYLGMNVRVTFPYTAAMRVEHTGKVRRIDVLRAGGYLVAVELSLNPA